MIQYRFVSTGEEGRPPAGEYLFTLWDGAELPELAWRAEPSQRIVWSAPLKGEPT